MKWFSVILFLMFSSAFYAQNSYSGKVLDSTTHEPLPFVNIRVENSEIGFTTDIDGIFSFSSDKKVAFFEFNYIGYKKRNKKLQQGKSNVVFLVENSIGLKEFVIDADYNPAHRIVKAVIANRKANNPEKNLNYTYESYNKLTFSAVYDSLKAASKDSAIIKMQQFFARQDLMLLETVVETSHKAPNQTKDVVKATRTSGLKSTMLPILATELQSFSFYNTFFTLSNIQYISPITNEGFGKYSYELLDEFVEEKDTIFVIAFKPKKGRTFDAMQGVLHISSYKFGIKNVIAKPVSPEGTVEVQINQKYQLIDSVWFPEQLNSNLLMKDLSMEGLNLVGKTISYLKNINLNPTDKELKFDNISVEIDVKNKQQNDSSLVKSRYTPLTPRDSLTYKVIDSIGKVAKLDKKIQIMESLLEGKIPLGKIDLDMNNAFGYNQYEGFRLGAGLYTNHKLMKRISIGGYFAYGFKDKVWKYGGEFDAKIWPKKGIGINVSYSDDISQAGSTNVGESKKMTSNQNLYELYTNLYDHNINWTASLRFRIKGIKAKLIGKMEKLTTNYLYQFNEPIGLNTAFANASFYYSFIGFEASFSPFSKVMYNGTKLVDISSKYPVFSMSFYKTISYLTTNEVTRLLAKVTDDFTLPFLGKSSYALVGGIVSGNVPFSYLFNQQGTKENFNLSVFESFETMFTNEFYASSFVNAFWEQNFGTVIKKGMFQPEFSIYQGVGFGNKLNVEPQQFLTGKSMEKGYYESGIKIHNIIHSGTSGFGFGVFYRYGPYSLPVQKDNFTYKITVSLGF